jgi:hypothetical protein
MTRRIYVPSDCKGSIILIRQLTYMVYGCRECFILLLWLLPAIAACSQETNKVDMFSPKLRGFLDSNASAAQLLNKVLCDAFAKRGIQIYYFYSTNQPRAYHYYTESNSVVIAIREDQQSLDEFLSLVYESLNSENEEGFVKLMQKAERGKIAKGDYAHEMLKGEYKAAKKAQSLIRKLTFSSEDIAGSFFYQRIANCQDNFDGFLAAIEEEATTSRRDPLKYYEAQYDLLRKH